MKIAQNLSLLVLASGVAVASIALVNVPEKPLTTSNVPARDSKTKPTTEEQIFLTVDDAVQTLFADMSLINRAAAKSGRSQKSVGPFFGFSRMPEVSTHTVISQQLMEFKSAKDYKDVMQSYMKEGYDVGAFGFTSYPGLIDSEKLRLRYADATSSAQNWWMSRENRNWSDPKVEAEYKRRDEEFGALNVMAQEFARESAATLLKRPDAAVTKRVGTVTLQARAIRLENEQCMTCHGDMKLGDPLGMMVYSVKRHSGL